MVNTKEIPPEAILLGVYLELQNGESRTETVITQGLLGNVAIFSRGWPVTFPHLESFVTSDQFIFWVIV